MNTVLASCLLIAAAAVDLSIAPDQPLPFVYVDDPLVIELVSPVDAVTRMKLRLTGTHLPQANDVTLGDIPLAAGAPRWCAIKDASHQRGAYLAEVALETAGEVQKHSVRFCRIDRPAAQHPLPLAAVLSGKETGDQLMALRAVGLREVVVAVDDPEFAAKLAQAAAMRFSVAVAVPAAVPAALVQETLADVEPGLCARIVRWEVAFSGDAAAFSERVNTLKQAGCPAPVAVAVENADRFVAFLDALPATPIRRCVLSGDPGAVDRARPEALRRGMVGWEYSFVLGAASLEKGDGFQKAFLGLLRAGYAGAALDADLVFGGGEPREIAAWINGLAGRLSGRRYVGECAEVAGGAAWLFRDSAKWFAAVWSPQNGVTVEIPLQGAADITVTDGLGNPIPGVDATGAALTLETGPVPVFVTGAGGGILGAAAAREGMRQAGTIRKNENLSPLMSDGLRRLLEGMEGEISGASSRARFLELVRFLPSLEAARMAGQPGAVAALDALTALARTLCVLEEDRGELFVEPTQDLVARSEDHQSLYVTSATIQDNGVSLYGDWLLEEVRRLVQEAETADTAGRKVEGAALAMLAEARAQGLALAAKTKAAPAPAPAVAPAAEEKTEEAPAPAEKEPAEEKPEQKQEAAVPPDGEVVHVVASGENPYTISKKYGVSLDDLLKWNKLTKKSRLNIGDKLVVKGAKAAPAPKASSSRRRR